MLLTEKKLRKIIRGILLKEVDDNSSQKIEQAADRLIQINNEENISKLSIEDKLKHAKRLKGNEHVYLDKTNMRMDELIEKYLNDFLEQGTSQDELVRYANDVKKYAKAAVKGPVDKAQMNFDMALASYRTLLSMNRSEEMKKDKTVSSQLALLKTYASTGVGPKKGKGQGSRKTRKSNPQIKTVQQLLNSIIDQQKIDGDYQGKKLDEDGRWGSRTRSATSKALSLFTQSALRKKYGFKGITDDGLNTEKSGGAGSWKRTLSKLVKGVTPEGNGSDNFGKGKYGTLIYVLTKLSEYKKEAGPNPEPGPGDGDRTNPGFVLEEIGKAYAAARDLYGKHKNNWIGENILDYGKSIKKLTVEVDTPKGESISIDPIRISTNSKIKFSFPCKHKGDKLYSFEFQFEAKSNDDLGSAEITLLDSNENLESAPSRGKTLNIDGWKKFPGKKVMGTKENWWLDGEEFIALCLYAVRRSLLTEGILQNKKDGGEANVKDFLKKAFPKEE